MLAKNLKLIIYHLKNTVMLFSRLYWNWREIIELLSTNWLENGCWEKVEGKIKRVATRNHVGEKINKGSK